MSGIIRAGVMGWPVGHSRSPRLHGWWLKHYGIQGSYDLLPVRPEDLGAAIRALAAKGFAGANLTVPHKQAALAFVDHLDDMASILGAVNTVVVQADGSILGSNTDGYGFRENLKEARPDWRAAAGPAVVIGAGGAARAVCAALAFDKAPEIRLVNRTLARAERLAADLGGPIKAVAWEQREAALEGAALLVNTTTQGMTGEPPLDLDLRCLPVGALVNDIVYVPLETPLLAQARARGNAVVDGLGMLLHQGRPGFAAWFGTWPEVTPELRAFVLAA